MCVQADQDMNYTEHEQYIYDEDKYSDNNDDNDRDK